ncbi:MAG: serine/threonine-protein phosphatase [Deltaproteobacteria bacterium]|nr:serine/threonine-protein phosphatase [Deltaproteobacteria bacterium]
MRRQSHARSDVGMCRVSNEDAYWSDDELGLYVVADGMGGHAAGEVASAEAIDALVGMVQRGRANLERDVETLVKSGTDEPDAMARIKRIFESAVQNATYMVYGLADLDPEQYGMGTTISALMIAADRAWIAHVGDSRIYMVRHGVATQLTEDHTLTAWQVRQGLISQEEAAQSPHRNVITRAVGNREYVQVDVQSLVVREGDRFLVCSDGLHGYLEDDEVALVLTLPGDDAVKRFVDLANERGGRDNITCIVIEVD